ncbi:MAG TPA: hypothetical protein VKF84_00155 [Candidatus Sulfotelmatobacter sp.]|nr:hypothetical protein [Candidatus Sulfotelmatobacter sp.]
MKKSSLPVAILLVMIAALAGCGSNSHVAGDVSGNWAATLSGTGPDTFAFNTLLAVHADGSLGSSNFSFTANNTHCFPSATTETGSFTLQGNFNGQVSGGFQYTITGAEGNVLTLNGTVQNGQITGTWTLTGTIGCSGNGNFTMIPAA